MNSQRRNTWTSIVYYMIVCKSLTLETSATNVTNQKRERWKRKKV